MRVARVLFARLPEFGGVKSRLASDLDEHGAFLIYRWLLRVQHRVFLQKPDARNSFTNFVFFTPAVARLKARLAFYPDLSGFSLKFRAQCDGDLGARLTHATQHALAGHDLALIWGADIPCLPRSIETQAIALAPQSVMTPARDGGYAFLSIAKEKFSPEIFSRIRWSTSLTARDQVRALKECGVNVVLSGKVTDLDRAHNLVRIIRELEQNCRDDDLTDLARTLASIPVRKKL